MNNVVSIDSARRNPASIPPVHHVFSLGEAVDIGKGRTILNLWSLERRLTFINNIRYQQRMTHHKMSADEVEHAMRSYGAVYNLPTSRLDVFVAKMETARARIVAWGKSISLNYHIT